MNHDRIVAAVEAHRVKLGMRRYHFATVCLGIAGTHYADICHGRKKFSVRLLRELYAMGLPAEVLLGVQDALAAPPRAAGHA